ncbi:hypothetical protein EDB81DRAFT_899345, partial [Dactylonectria macrodidyma]
HVLREKFIRNKRKRKERYPTSNLSEFCYFYDNLPALGVAYCIQANIRMPAELILAIVGLLPIIETCSRAYAKLETLIIRLPSLASKFELDVRIESRKFSLYRDYLVKGDAGTPDNNLFEQQSEHTREIIADVVHRITRLLEESNEILEKYGYGDASSPPMPGQRATPPTTATTAMTTTMLTAWPFGDQRSPRAATAPSIKLTERLQWAWNREARVASLLSDLRKYNDDLWHVLNPYHERILRLGLTAFVVPGVSDPAVNRFVESDSSSLTNELLAACLRLRYQVTRLSHQQASGSSQHPDWMSPNRLRAVGSFQGSTAHAPRKISFMIGDPSDLVIVEYYDIAPSVSVEYRAQVGNRIAQLSRLFSEPYDPSLRFLRCLGAVHDPSQPLRYGLVFKAPLVNGAKPSTFRTLDSLLQDETFHVPSLGQPFGLAKALAVALMHMHAAGWVHKSLRPENIIFCQSSREDGYPEIDITQPRLLGFTLSRPTDAASLQTWADRDLDIFTHPERQGQEPLPPFTLRHDHYSLGVVLVSIALWLMPATLRDGFDAMPEPDSGIDRATGWSIYIENLVKAKLGRLAGDIYKNVALGCLTGRFEPQGTSRTSSDRDLQMDFFNYGVKILMQCKA